MNSQAFEYESLALKAASMGQIQDNKHRVQLQKVLAQTLVTTLISLSQISPVFAAPR